MSAFSRCGGAVLCAALCSSCIPLAWQVDVADAGSAGGGMGSGGGSGLGGGTGFGGGVNAGGGMPPVGGGMPPVGGGPAGLRPDVPVVIGEFNALANGPFPRGQLRSSALATVPGTSTLVAVMDDADFLYVLGMPNRRIPLSPGARPSSVAVSPDGQTAWVALRGPGSLARVSLSTGLVQQVAVGAEPTGVALSPTGRTAVVATFGERSVSFVDTSSLTVTRVDVGGNPRALTITDDGDGLDSDESAWVTLFYGEPVAEGSDTGRRGVVVELSLGQTPAMVSRVLLAPLTTGTGQCSPNQLTAIAQRGPSLFVTHVCAAPAAPQNPNEVVFPGLSVISLAARTEDRSPNGSQVVRGWLVPLPANPVDVVPMDWAPASGMLVLAQGANTLLVPASPVSVRVALTPLYGTNTAEDPLDGVPTAVLAVRPGQVFALDASGRRVLQFTDPLLSVPPLEFAFETLPPVYSAAYRERLGRKHFASAEGPWSTGSRMSCTSCHPDGLTDGLTWVFGAGPRQTPALTGTFHRSGLHRAQNWTANADEISDVEGLVRSTMGGSGVINVMGGAPISLEDGVAGPGGIARHDGLSASSLELVYTFGGSDWVDIEAWLASLPKSPASPRLDPLAVGRGRQLFSNGGCAACHGGPLWTVSRVPYVPSFQKNGSAVGANLLPTMPSGLRTEQAMPHVLWKPELNVDTLKVAPEVVTVNGSLRVIGPERITCVLRNVGTYDVADPLEVKANGTRAQGELGFNPPSLLGLATSAPYLHHGQAKTLTELFSPRYRAHHELAVPGFLAGADGGVEVDQVRDLSAFLESIDDTTPPFATLAGSDICVGY